MRALINRLALIENADEFSTKGHAGKIRQNDPRFSDNPMRTPEAAEELDELDDTSMRGLRQMDRLHSIFKDAGISDQEIQQGIQLSDAGIHKIAGAMGSSPGEVKLLIASLTQHLRDEQDDEDNRSLQEQYFRFIEAEGDDSREHPFQEKADKDHLSAEQDYLGDITVRSAKRGKERFFQGSDAANITKKLATLPDDNERQDVLRTLVTEDDVGFEDEINREGGSYNFPWKLDGQTGFGTMRYGMVGGKPSMRLISVRTADGDDLDLTSQMRHALLMQARAFIPDA
jgi:hypothetical protein